MARNLNTLFVILLAVAVGTLLLHDSTAQTSHVVGDGLGWTIPSSGAAVYNSWASSHSFKLGDFLVFNYHMNVHNVEEVTKEDYDSCNSASPLASYGNPPVRVTLNHSGPHYFICGVPGHCSAGQKLAINVTGTASTAPPASSIAAPPSTSTTPSSPSPAGVSGSASPPPQNSGATSLGSAPGLFVILIASLVAAFFF